ncbi:spore-associated protein A [Streptomyces sp. NPDC097640]|uniref:spore-associated protein A n=1 Tax=Streptomyces sp. NPDC097640 TaxID=3157229 RepID=UPI00331A3385
MPIAKKKRSRQAPLTSKPLMSIGVITGACIASLTVTSPSTHAAEAARAYGGECGVGYVEIDSYHLSTGATAYLTFSSASGNNCVVTKRDTVGTALRLGAGVRRSGEPGSAHEDIGNYTSYAGPVYVYARYSCVDWGGYFNGLNKVIENDHCDRQA